MTEKAHENWVRRLAFRHGYQMHKSRRRDPGAMDHGLWSVVSTRTGQTVDSRRGWPPVYNWSLDEIVAFLTGEGDKR
jgi:hypothetical protein